MASFRRRATEALKTLFEHDSALKWKIDVIYILFKN